MLADLANQRPVRYFRKGGGFFILEMARHMNQEWLEIEKAREKEREKAWQKKL